MAIVNRTPLFYNPTKCSNVEITAPSLEGCKNTKTPKWKWRKILAFKVQLFFLTIENRMEYTIQSKIKRLWSKAITFGLNRQVVGDIPSCWYSRHKVRPDMARDRKYERVLCLAIVVIQRKLGKLCEQINGVSHEDQFWLDIQVFYFSKVTLGWQSQ